MKRSWSLPFLTAFLSLSPFLLHPGPGDHPAWRGPFLLSLGLFAFLVFSLFILLRGRVGEARAFFALLFFSFHALVRESLPWSSKQTPMFLFFSALPVLYAFGTKMAWEEKKGLFMRLLSLAFLSFSFIGGKAGILLPPLFFLRSTLLRGMGPVSALVRILPELVLCLVFLGMKGGGGWMPSISPLLPLGFSFFASPRFLFASGVWIAFFFWKVRNKGLPALFLALGCSAGVFLAALFPDDRGLSLFVVLFSSIAWTLLLASFEDAGRVLGAEGPGGALIGKYLWWAAGGALLMARLLSQS